MKQWLILMFGISLSLPSLANVADIDFSKFNEATILASKGHYKQASNKFHSLSLQVLAENRYENEEQMWQVAGLAEALATITANRDYDVNAYLYWSNSVRYLLTGGGDWQQMQQWLKEYYEQEKLPTEQSVFLNTSSRNNINRPEDIIMIQVWIDQLGIFSFKAPRKGLKDTSSNRNNNQQLSVPVIKSGDAGPTSLKGLNTDFNKTHGFIIATPQVESKESLSSSTTPKILPQKISKDSVLVETQFNKNKVIPNETQAVDKAQLKPVLNRHLIAPNTQSSESSAPLINKKLITDPDHKIVSPIAEKHQYHLHTVEEISPTVESYYDENNAQQGREDNIDDENNKRVFISN